MRARIVLNRLYQLIFIRLPVEYCQ